MRLPSGDQFGIHPFSPWGTVARPEPGIVASRQRRTIVAAVVRLAMKLIGVGVALILMAPAAWSHDESSAFHVTITYQIKVYSFDVVSAPELS